MMVDCISKNLSAVLKLYAAKPPVWAGYDTGTPDIQYSQADWNLVPSNIIRVHIDQGFGSPAITTSHVRDVEPGAWEPAKAVNLSNWKTPRPTIYCDRSDLTRPGGVIDSGWKGDIWLADPATSEPKVAPVYPGVTVVAQQWYFGTNHDQDVIFDPYWPDKKPDPPPAEWTYGPPQHLTVRAGYHSVGLVWDAPAGHYPEPVAQYWIYIYKGTTCNKETLVPSYPRSTIHRVDAVGSLQEKTEYTVHVVASGPNHTHTKPFTYASAVFTTA